jgi:hypothetical protein
MSQRRPRWIHVSLVEDRHTRRKVQFRWRQHINCEKLKTVIFPFETATGQKTMLPMIPSKTKRFYQTVFKNHDNEILGMFCLRSNELLSIDSNGGLKKLHIETLISETLDLFGDSKDRVTCVQANEEGGSLFFGLETGAIWTSDLTTSDELIYSHSRAVTAIASAKSTVFSAGLDLKIKMFNLKTQSIVANIDCATEVDILKPLPNIFGLPLVVGDISGSVSIWSPHMLKSSTQSVQFCCQLSSKILSISQVNLFNRPCIVCTTASMISIYAIAVKKGSSGKDHISLLKDEIYSLVRTISPPNQETEFLSCISMNYTPPSSSSSSNASTSSSSLPLSEMNTNAALLSACSDGNVYQWEPLTGQVMRRFRVTNDNTLPCLGLIYLPTFQMFAVTDSENSLYLVNFSSTPLVSSIPITSTPHSNFSSPTSPTPSLAKVIVTCATAMDTHSTLIAYGDSNGHVHLHSNLTQETHSKSSSSLTAATAISMIFLEITEELVILSGHSNGMIFFYICSVDGIFPSLENSRHQQITAIYNSKITAIQNISTDTTTVATASELESIVIWKVNSKGMTKVTQLSNSAQMLTMISHPGGYLIASDPTHQLHVWKINENWKKIVPSSTSPLSLSSRSLTSPRASLVSSVSQRLGLYFDQRKGIHYITTALVSLSPPPPSPAAAPGGGGRGRFEDSTGGENKIKFYKIANQCELLLDGIVELPLQCSDISFWSNGESNLVFLQSAVDGKVLSLNIQSYDTINSFAQSRHFLSRDYLLANNTSSPHHRSRSQTQAQARDLDCQIIAISGNTSPILLTCETHLSTQIQTLHVWNNDLHDLDQFYHTSLLLAMDQTSTLAAASAAASSWDQPFSEASLSSLIESHPHYPTSLLVSEITSTQPHSFFFTTLLSNPTLFRKYLPKVPIAVTQSAFVRSSKHTLLSYALQLKDGAAVDLILSQWITLLSSSSSLQSGYETCRSQYHLMELFQDFKLLASLQPTKFAQFLVQLPLLTNHSVVQQNYSTHRMVSFSSPSSALLNLGGGGSEGEENGDVCMMRGTEYRVVPSFWSSLNSTGAVKGAYPDLMGRVLAPEEEEIFWKPYEQPHDCQALQQSFTSGIAHNPHQLHHKKILLSLVSSLQPVASSKSKDDHPEEIEEKEEKGSDVTRGKDWSPQASLSASEGIMVQSFIHPVPYAASGIEFLSLCHSSHQLTGSKSTLLSSPLVSSVIDYKWNSYFSKSYHSRVFHSLFLLVLFCFHCVYYEELTNSPSKTGLPALVFIVSIFLLFNYSLLLLDLFLRFLTERSPLTVLGDPWFYVGTSAYLSVITGISMILSNRSDSPAAEDVRIHSSFNSRCVLSAASLLLFLQFLSSLM